LLERLAILLDVIARHAQELRGLAPPLESHDVGGGRPAEDEDARRPGRLRRRVPATSAARALEPLAVDEPVAGTQPVAKGCRLRGAGRRASRRRREDERRGERERAPPADFRYPRPRATELSVPIAPARGLRRRRE